MDKHASKPLPKTSPAGQPYWDGLKQGRLLIQQCAACRTLRHYPRPVCDACYSMEVAWLESRGAGKVHSWTVCHHAYHPGFAGDLSYTLLTVDLDEGVRALGRLRDGDPATVRIGLPVRVGYEAADDGFVLPVFDLTGA